MPIQKSAAKNFIVVDLEFGSDGGVVLTLLLYFFWVFTFSPPNINFVIEIKRTRIDSAFRFAEGSRSCIK